LPSPTEAADEVVVSAFNAAINRRDLVTEWRVFDVAKRD
jgi:hypothetical protein